MALLIGKALLACLLLANLVLSLRILLSTRINHRGGALLLLWAVPVLGALMVYAGLKEPATGRPSAREDMDYDDLSGSDITPWSDSGSGDSSGGGNWDSGGGDGGGGGGD